MSRRLVIDTATEACSVALLEDGEVVAHFHDVVGRGHAERILPIIAGFPDGGKADEIWVDCGPGSFTGVRIGIAAAKGLSIAWGVPVLGYSVMALIDAGAAMQQAGWKDEKRAIVMEGGHGEWFVQLFGETGHEPLLSLKPADAVTLVGEIPVAGSRALQLSELRGGGKYLNLLPDARWSAHLSRDDLTQEPRPIYGRGADAKKMTD